MGDFADQQRDFNASLGGVMGGWMLEVAKADLVRQSGWVSAVQQLATPDKDGNIPQVTLASGLTGPDGKPIDGAAITFPVVLALLGQQFAAETADLSMSMNVDATTLDETKGEQQGTAEASGEGSILGFKVSLKVTASFSESEDRKRTSDMRSVTTASVHMARVPTPEPIQRVLEAFMRIVDVQCKLAEAHIAANGQDQARAQGLLPSDKPAPSGGGNGT